MRYCKKCQINRSVDDIKFCFLCGDELVEFEIKCIYCGKTICLVNKFCEYCGKSQTKEQQVVFPLHEMKLTDKFCHLCDGKGSFRSSALGIEKEIFCTCSKGSEKYKEYLDLTETEKLKEDENNI